MKIKDLILILGAITAYLGVITYVRMSNDRALEGRCYHLRREDYTKNRDQNEQYVSAAGRSNSSFALSEVQGYEILLAAKAGEKHLGSRTDFQKLDNYYLAYRLTSSDLMSQKQKGRKNIWHDNPVSAGDGNIIIAQASLHVNGVWPGRGCRSQAINLINDIKRLEIDQKAKIVTVGNRVSKDSRLYSVLRASDVMPKTFEELYQVTGDQAWLTTKKKMPNYLQELGKKYNTGLVLGFAWISNNYVRPAQANEVAINDSDHYSANACRVPMLLAENDDREAVQVVERMLKFFKKKRTSAGFTLKGEKLHHYQSASLSAPVFVAASKYRSQDYDILIEQERHISSRPLPKDNYYDATLAISAALNANELAGLGE